MLLPHLRRPAHMRALAHLRSFRRAASLGAEYLFGGISCAPGYPQGREIPVLRPGSGAPGRRFFDLLDFTRFACGRERRRLSRSPIVVPVLRWTVVHLLGWEGRELLGTGPGILAIFMVLDVVSLWGFL